VQVTDHGQGFDPASARGRRPGSQSERGRGLAIMEGVMDRVEVVSQPGQGTRVTLVKRLAFTPGSAVRRVLGAPVPDP
jgi:anti-sigma regulatory factor (Ser/Thr protein kinase)